MEKEDPKKLFELWKSGETLYESLFQFTDDEVYKKYIESEEEWDRQINTSPNPNTKSTFFDRISEFSKTYSKYQKTRTTLDHLKSNLVKNLQSGEIMGIGFEAPIDSESAPKIIPTHIWPENIFRIDWNESTFSIGGATFLKIRIIEFDESDFDNNSESVDEEMQLSESDDEYIPRGRPSRKPAIREAYEHLRDNGEIDYSKPFRSHIPAIRKIVIERNPQKGDKGLGEEVIRRTVKPSFDQEKQALEASSKTSSKL